ncbi:hypothetical protein [Deinococcus sp. UR1]|uniref:hypothetical protein n=1 Tax=Deinococcus sp. UR1 TaxID=1704277 RepID=UPI000C190ABD|nr:hypothetical protein [Deinococcus sp. UR1]PIG95926.1 hypothetical protein AMD26_019115 [Deinococcus sp. UR1]
MAPETYEEQLARELLRLGVTSRLKNVPTFHFWEIGKGKREAYRGLQSALVAFQRREMSGERLTPKEQGVYRQLKEWFADPEVNAYTMELQQQDEQTEGRRHLQVAYRYRRENFKLDRPAETTKQIVDHFYPIRWPEFNELSDWEIMREVIPAMQVARVDLKVYEEQRWLYDERSQRAAEVLAYRIQNLYVDQQLPELMKTTEQQRDIFEEYAARLERGTNARRWFQEMLSKLNKPRKTR